MNITDVFKNRKVIALILAIIALVSMFGISGIASSPELHADTIQALEEKRDTVMGLVAASTAASVAITLLPGDIATPVGENLADLSFYFLLVLSALYLEKYLVTITGYIAFSYIVPAACGCLILYLFWQKKQLVQISAKLAIFAVALCLIIPVSVGVSNIIDNTYASSIEQTISSAQQAAEEIPKQTEETEEKEEGFWSSIVSQVTEGVSEAVSSATKKFETMLNNFIEALAVMIVTSCLIPLFILFLFVWLGKTILGFNVSLQETLPKILPRKLR